MLEPEDITPTRVTALSQRNADVSYRLVFEKSRGKLIIILLPAPQRVVGASLVPAN